MWGVSLFLIAAPLLAQHIPLTPSHYWRGLRDSNSLSLLPASPQVRRIGLRLWTEPAERELGRPGNP